MSRPLTLEDLDLLRQLGVQTTAGSAPPIPQYQAPVGKTLDTSQDPAPPDPAAPYNDRAGQYQAQASELDKQATTPYPQPVGVKQHLVEAARAAMENFGRYGAPGGYYGQEEKRQKDFTDKNTELVKRASDLRNQSRQQQDLGQQVKFQDSTVANNTARLGIEQDAETRLQGEADQRKKVQDRPVGNDVGMGVTRVFTNPDTGQEVPNTRIQGTAKPEANYNLTEKILDEGNGKYGRYAFDMRATTPEGERNRGRLGDAPPPSSSTGGMPSVQKITGADGTEQLVSVNQRSATATPVTMAGDTTKTPLQGPSAGRAGDRAVVAADVNLVDAKRLLKSMEDTLARINSGQSKAVGADDMALLSNHIAMTMGQVKGARSGRDIIEAHKNAISLDQRLSRAVNNVMNGGQLSPEQRAEFVDLARRRVNEMSQTPGDLRDALGGPSAQSGVPAVGGTFNGEKVKAVTRIQ